MKHAALAVLVTSSLAFALSAPAEAAEKKRGSDLPGVSKDMRLVKPAEDAPWTENFVKDEDGFVRIGENTRMKISGLIRYDIDFNTRNRKTPLQPR